MRLGGFVLHGNNVDTLGAALDGLKATCDEVLAVDSNSTDGSSALVEAKGVRSINHSWEGFGAARAAAARALAHCDYLFFLDSDESLSDRSIAAIQAWRASAPRGAYYRLRRDDWAELPTGRFRFRTEHRKRLIRVDFARWRPDMVVHEALTDKGDVYDLAASIDHRFITSFEERGRRNDLYALLWAVQTFCREARDEGTSGRRVWHCFRYAFLKGAFARGGVQGLRLSWRTAGYHARKYHYLRELAHGGFPLLVEAWRQAEYGRLMQLAAEQVAICELAGAESGEKRFEGYMVPSLKGDR